MEITIKKSDILYRFYIICYLFMVLYRPFIVKRMTSCLLIFTFIAFFFIKRNIVIKSKSFKRYGLFSFIVCLLFATLYTIIIAWVNNTGFANSITYLKLIIYGSIFAVYVCNSMNKRGYTIFDFIDCVLGATVIQFCFVIVMLLNPTIKTNIISTLISNGALGIDYSRLVTYQQRTFGLADQYFSGLGVLSGILAVICIELAISKGYKYILYIPELLITSALNARTGLSVFCVGTMFILFMAFYDYGKKHLRIMKIIAGGTVGIFLFVTLIKYFAPDSYKWLSELSSQIGIMLSGEGNASYYNLNSSNWVWPSLFEIIFGTGRSIFGQEGIANFNLSYDSGYLNTIYVGGLILSIILYVGLFSLFYHKSLKKNKIMLHMCVSMFISLLFIHIKGSIFFLNDYMIFCILFIAAYSFLECTDNKKYEDIYQYREGENYASD